ncbi:hypothetical protein D3C73_1047920 [compost metagenome]
MAVGTDAHAAALGEEIHRRENPVAQVGFGGQAQAGDGATAGHQRDLFRVGVGGVNQAPALIDLDVLIQPLQGATAAPVQAVIDFLLLLGDMDVHRASLVAGGQDFADLLWGHGAQRVEAQAQRLGLLLGQKRLQPRLQVQVVFRAVDKPTLAIVGRLATET